jgi:MFS family permease
LRSGHGGVRNFPLTSQINDKIKKSLRYSVLDGSGWAAMMGFTQSYTTPFALALKASTSEIGVLSSLPQLLLSLGQLLTPRLTERVGGRMRLMVPVIFGQAIMLIPLIFVPFIFPEPKVLWVIIFVTLGSLLGNMANPAWGSMMADLVPPNVRGSYFSMRGRITGFVMLVASLLAGGILQILNHQVFIGFALLFGAAALFRFASLYYLSRQYDPPMVVQKTSHPGLWMIFREMSKSNLGNFNLYFSLMNFFTMISAPFFAVFMLRDLNFNYTYYMLIICTNALSNMLFQTFWGRRADRAGNLMVIRVTSFILPLLPLTYVFTSNIVILMCSEVISGCAWGGFNLTSLNFVFDSTQPATRTKQIALFNAIAGGFLFVGALIGGFIIPHLPPVNGYQLRTLFIISGALRALLVLVMLHMLKEVRNVPKVGFLQFITGRL